LESSWAYEVRHETIHDHGGYKRKEVLASDLLVNEGDRILGRPEKRGGGGNVSDLEGGLRVKKEISSLSKGWTESFHKQPREG